MRVLCVFSTLAIFGLIFFASAEMPIKTKHGGPYTATCLAQRHTNLIVSGQARVTANQHGIDAYYHMGYTQLNPWKGLKSTSNPGGIPIDGAFTVPYRYPRSNMDRPKKLHATASIWGLDSAGQGRQAVVSDTSN